MIPTVEGADPQLVSEVWERDEYRVRPRIAAGSRVIDIGAHVGTFTLLAISLGATVVAVEPYLPNVVQLVRNIDGDPQVTVRWAAAGNTDGMCGMIRRGLGVQTDWAAPDSPTGLRVRMLSLGTLIGEHPVDVLKVDAEGAEYDILIGADLTLVDYLTMELHLWATPDHPIPGLGQRDYPMPIRPRALVDWIEQTHNVELNGNLEAGGYLFGTRR